MSKSNKKEKKKLSYDIQDVMILKKAIDEITYHCVKASTIEDIPYFDKLLYFGLDLGELITHISFKNSLEPVLQSPEYDFDTSAI